MNYTVAVFVVVGIVAAANWVSSARKVYRGPRDAESVLERTFFVTGDDLAVEQK